MARFQVSLVYNMLHLFSAVFLIIFSISDHGSRGKSIPISVEIIVDSIHILCTILFSSGFLSSPLLTLAWAATGFIELLIIAPQTDN